MFYYMLCLEVNPGRLEFKAAVGRRDVQKEMACAVNMTEPFLTELCCMVAQTHQFAATADVTGYTEVLGYSGYPGTGGCIGS